MSGFCSRWVPQPLTPKQMGVRVEICSAFLERIRAEGSNFTDRIVTCDETWVHFYEPQSKQQNSVWKHPKSPSPVKHSVGKVMCIVFFSLKFSSKSCCTYTYYSQCWILCPHYSNKFNKGHTKNKQPGPSCSKLTMSLVNNLLKFTSSDTQICWNFLLKKCE